MSLSDLNAIPLNVIEKADENPSLKVVSGDRPLTTDPSSLERNGFRLDVPELNSDEDEKKLKDFEASGGEAALMTEAFYNVGGISSTAPEWLKSAIESRANYLQKTADSFTKGNGGPVGKKTKQEEAEENNEKAAEWAGDQMDRIEREQKRQAEWELKSIDVGNGVKMTGKEIDAVLELLGTKEGKQKFVDAFKKKTGANDEDANKAVTDYERYMQLLRKKELEGLTQEEEKYVQTYPTTADGKDMISLGKRSENYVLDFDEKEKSDIKLETKAVTATSYSKEAESIITPKFNEKAATTVAQPETKVLNEIAQSTPPISKPSETMGISFG